MHTSVRIPLCTSATGRDSLLAQHGDDHLFQLCLLPRSKGTRLTHRAVGWKMVHGLTRTRGWCWGIRTSQQQARQQGPAQQFLVLYHSFKAHLITRGLFLPMQSLILL